MNDRAKSILLGVLLILFGIALLLDKIGVWIFSWEETYPVIFLAISALSFLHVSGGKRDSAFWGTLFGLMGLFFLLRNYGLVYSFWFVPVWPVLLFSVGISFIVLYFFKPHDWAVLIPGSILTFIGLVFLLQELNVWWLGPHLVRDFWPLLLVIVGIILIIGSIAKKD